ncbi:hypothetical protein B0H14DRAFT_3881128 [Mycena olivaceomarginata]|nr:hypothetical protein B0H14DRAFT_3881128 [Mycena olivaceomarginata]
MTSKDKENRHKSSCLKSSHKSSSRKSTGDLARKGQALRDHNHSRRSPAEEHTGDVGSDAALRARVHQLEVPPSRQLKLSSNRAPLPTIPHPDKLSAVTMNELKALLKMDKLRWNAMRTFTRHRLHAGDLRPELVWKKQDTLALGVISRAISNKFPELQRFEGNWATYRIMKESWDNIKMYQRDVDRPNTYVGRKAVERRRRRATPSSPTQSCRESPHPPTPGPSRHRSTSPTSLATAPRVPKPRPLRRATDSDSGSDSGSGAGAGSGSQSGSDDDDNNDDMVLAGDETMTGMEGASSVQTSPSRIAVLYMYSV